MKPDPADLVKHVVAAITGALHDNECCQWTVGRRNEGGRASGVHFDLWNGVVLSVAWLDGVSYSNVARGYWVPGEAFTFEAAAWHALDEATASATDVRAWIAPPNCNSMEPLLSYATIGEIVDWVVNHLTLMEAR